VKHYEPISKKPYTINGEFIAEYISRKQASDITGIGSQNISSVCSGRRKIAGGFVWK